VGKSGKMTEERKTGQEKLPWATILVRPQKNQARLEEEVGQRKTSNEDNIEGRIDRAGQGKKSTSTSGNEKAKEAQLRREKRTRGGKDSPRI